MAEIELIMPKMGESVAEATITNWLKSEGDSIEAEEPVLEIATDKVDSEIPAPETGILKKILFQVDDVVKVGEVIAIIEVEGEASSSAPITIEEKAPQAVQEIQNSPTTALTEELTKNSPSGKFLSPLVRSISEKEGISGSELDLIKGTGLNDRITKDDLVLYIENRGKANSKAPQAVLTPNLE